MARVTLADMEPLSRRRQNYGYGPTDPEYLQQNTMYPRSLPPVGLGPHMVPQDPSRDTFEQRFAPANQLDDLMQRQQYKDLMRGQPVRPGTQERFMDPTKVISDLPPSLNAPMARTAAIVPAPTGRSGWVPDEAPAPAALPPAAAPLPPSAAPKPAEIPPGWELDMPEQPSAKARPNVPTVIGTERSGLPTDNPVVAAQNAAALRMQRAVGRPTPVDAPGTREVTMQDLMDLDKRSLQRVLDAVPEGVKSEILKMFRGPQ